MKSFQQASFNPISSDLSLGASIADISQGWDGTLWAIDTNGAPHTYDPLQGVWNPQGTGIDAAALVGTSTYHFRGPEVVEVTFGANQAGVPALISEKWPALPPSFQLGVHGAANVNGTLYLFGRGLYVSVDQPSEVSSLDQLKGWPTTGGWAGGAIDGACSLNGDQVLLFRNGEYITISISERAVVTNPSPISQYGPFHSVPAQFLGEGFTGGYLFGPNNDNSKVTIYNGPGLVSYDIGQPAPGPKYVAAVYSNWPANWNPTLAHAPSGRVGNLWSAMADGKGVVYHDGDQWNAISGEATYASVGSDGSVFTIGSNSLFRWQGGGDFQKLASPRFTFKQLSAGDQNTICAVDTRQNVYAYDAASAVFSPHPQVPKAVHISTNSDGSLWHCQSDPNAFRFSTGDTESQAMPVSAASVQKVASTGFGVSYCLTSDQKLYTYDSPYIFKSLPVFHSVFQTMEQGLGRLFLIDRAYTGEGNNASFQDCVVSVDIHTGKELWRTAASPANVANTAPVYDGNLQLVYTGSAPKDPNDAKSQGWMIALNAQTGTIAWAHATRAGIDAAPALSGSQLCCGDRSGMLYMMDTQALLSSTGGAAPVWTVQGASTGPFITRIATPVITEDLVYFEAWFSNSNNNNPDFRQPTILIQTCNAQDGTSPTLVRTLLTPVADPSKVPLDAPKLGQGAEWLYIQGLNEIHGVNLANPGDPNNPYPQNDRGYSPGHGITFTTGLACSNGIMWVGASNGAIYAFDATCTPTCHTPVVIDPHNPISCTPVPYTTGAGAATVFFTVATHFELFALDPVAGNYASIPIGNSWGTSLSKLITNGTLYVAGSPPVDIWGSQIFGVRVDGLASSLRDFIVESQLLQDYNPPASAAQSVSTTQAQYQTHLTVVDDLKTPRPRQNVKIWAGEPGTTILVNGQSFTVGPDDSSFASVQTGPDGMVSIVTDASDMSAVPLRIWSEFMDPYERVLVYPDREFHDRLMTAHANAADDDPDKVNLATATSYDNKPLFTSQEQQSQTPSHVAGAIQQMGGASGLNASGVGASGLRLSASPAKYAAYSDLAGQHYFPFNVPASRPAAVANALGLSFIGEESSSLSFSSAAEATLAIDALLGQAWTSDTATPGAPLLGGWFSDFWNWIKKNVDGVVNKITHIIVSVAEEIYVGIRMIVNGMAKVFRAIIHTIEDVCKAVGAFFIKLGKLIVRVVEALSILFHWDKIIRVHNALKQTILDLLNSTSADMAAAVGVVKDFFTNFEQSLKDDINKLCSDPQKKAGITQNRQDPNAHTAFKVNGKSHAVQGMYMWNKTAANGGSASEKSSDALAATGDDPIWDLVNAIAAAAKNLGHDFEQIGSDVSNVLKATSVKQFAEDILKTLLDVIDLVIDAILDTSEGMAVACLQSFAVLASAFNALLTTPIDIPFVSWIYTEFISPGNPLTILDLFCLVIAIPIAFVGYAVTGAYPFQAAAVTGPPPASDTQTQRDLQISQGVGFIFQGLFVACSDFLGAVNEVGFWAKKGVSGLVAVCQTLTGAIGMALLPTKNNKADWSADPLATTNAAVGLVPLAMNLTGIGIAGNPAAGAAQKATNLLIKKITSALVFLAGLGRLSIFAYDWATATHPFEAKCVATQVGNVLSTLPLVFRPLTIFVKADKEPFEQAVLLVILVYADCIGFCGKGIIEIVLAALSTSEKQVGLQRAAGAAGWGMLPAPAA